MMRSSLRAWPSICLRELPPTPPPIVPALEDTAEPEEPTVARVGERSRNMSDRWKDGRWSAPAAFRPAEPPPPMLPLWSPCETSMWDMARGGGTDRLENANMAPMLRRFSYSLAIGARNSRKIGALCQLRLFKLVYFTVFSKLKTLFS